jgi:hypothetical protein
VVFLRASSEGHRDDAWLWLEKPDGVKTRLHTFSAPGNVQRGENDGKEEYNSLQQINYPGVSL